MAAIEFDVLTGAVLTVALPDQLFERAAALSPEEFRAFLRAELRRIEVDM